MENEKPLKSLYDIDIERFSWYFRKFMKYFKIFKNIQSTKTIIVSMHTYGWIVLEEYTVTYSSEELKL